MTANIKRVAFFERWLDPVAEQMLAGSPDIELSRLSFDDPVEASRAVLRRMHGYQVSTRGDLRGPWLADAALIEACPNLLAVQSTGAGFDVIDLEACTRAGIAVCNQAGSNKEAVAEHTLGLMLALSKRIAVSDKGLRTAAGVDRYAQIGNDIHGTTIGLVGIGHIGRRVAEICSKLFGMQVLACDPYLSGEEVAERGARKVELAELLRESDFVSVHCPRSTETYGMMNRAAFERMKRGAYFICTARGGIVVEDDLAEVIREGVIAGAGIDVFLKEPPPHDHPLLQFDNVIATPHIAGMTHEALREMAASAARQWVALLSGEVPPHLANPEVWPRFADRFESQLGFRPKPLPTTVA
ncbi:hydroxyacid dehydrogenase [Bosea sp. (in: a-proteobacteria)]|uniref:hydroxyacid dehydrogenase n=1 Tax=Bosea sp. (in: a-proteobacteria) TaxID=1871050 RepID=UPI002DDDAEE8|nr:hydroxyacid dehydrogenase [Bosea sp. (in: a-proteobacteria)]HEV2508440.1 hydroxyacid dehydrogenase [Bosea sp. (in: a-proteobacteria)]